jgi:hypothetical protein
MVLELNRAAAGISDHRQLDALCELARKLAMVDVGQIRGAP